MNVEIKNIKEFKFILSSGCSYGRMVSVVTNPFRECINKKIFEDYKTSFIDVDSKIIIFNLMMGSQGSDWQSDVIIRATHKLLELGVEPKNIYCLIEWSQWDRMSVHPYNFFDLDYNKFNWNSNNTFHSYTMDENLKYLDDNITNALYKHFNITNSIPLYNVGKINDRIYLNPSHMNPTDFRTKIDGVFEQMVIDLQEIEKSVMYETKIKNYLTNILKTQYFFESKNVKYNFLFMQSTLSGWNNIGDGLIKHELNMNFSNQYVKDGSVVINTNYKPINDVNKDLEVVLPEFKNDIGYINFKNIWFHENEKYRRGGIDEWTIENLKEVGYIKIDEYSEKLMGPNDIICNYNQHPNFVSYLSLWNKVTTNCDFMKVNSSFENYVLEKFWEDYDYDGFSKNYVTMSKKEWYKRSKN